MLEQLSNSVKFSAFYTFNKQGVTGLTVTVDVYSPSGLQIVSGAAATEVGGGIYVYTLSSGSTGTLGEYFAVFKTTNSSVDFQHIPSLWSLGRAGLDNLDATVSSRSTLTAAQVRTELSPELANLDATVSSRSTLTAAQVRTELSPELANLDTTVSSRSTLTAAQVRTELSPELANLDTTVSSRSTLTAPQVRTELSTELTEITETHLIHGLKSGSPLNVTPTSRTAGAISQTISGDGVTTTTVTR